MINNKNETRQYYLKLRSELAEDEINRNSKLICQKVLGLDEIGEMRRFGVYLATKGEVATRLLIDKIIYQKKEVFLPRFFGGEKVYYFVKFSGWDDLEVGDLGIMQPRNSKKIDTATLGVIFIPGVAFDKKGVRLGWGTGVYDKLLAGSKALKIGLAYDFQIAESLPKEGHDIKVDLIVTEKRILRTKAI